jgi:hypothetical protein
MTVWDCRDVENLVAERGLDISYETIGSEPVTEVWGLGAGNCRTIPRWLWMITEAEKGYFRRDTPDF